MEDYLHAIIPVHIEVHHFQKVNSVKIISFVICMVMSSMFLLES